MRVLVVDNYDSFTYNLVQQLGSLGAEVTVRRNDEGSVGRLLGEGFDGIVLSPGPGGPLGAGICCELVLAAAARGTPLLGVCLGHQCIARAFGGDVVRGRPVHGKPDRIEHDGRGVLAGLPSPLTVARYHSLVVVPDDVPRQLDVSAWTRDGVVMGLRHRRLPIEGVQFHPESFLSDGGLALVGNFLAGRRAA